MKIGLINMPFADITRPSIALAQLSTVINQQIPGAVIDEFYMNLDIAELLTPEVYEFISLSGPSNDIGFGDWFFRQEAFPEMEDNSKEYFERYGLHLGEESLLIYDTVIHQKRQELGVFLEGLIDKYKLHTYHIVGFTSMFMQNLASFALARRIKRRNPGAIIVMGGANCESPMGEEIVKSIEWVDYVFSGSALKSFPALVSNCLNGDMEKLDEINGVFSKNNTAPLLPGADPGKLKMIAPVGEQRPIQEVVELNYDGFLEAYNNKFSGKWKEPYLLFETSRGCWWGAKAHCTFCGLNGGNMAYRAIPEPKAVEYLNDLFDRYGSRVKHFACVDNIVPREYFKGVFPYLRVPENASIFYEVKADLTEQDIKVLADTHIVQIQPGIESLATSTLKLMRKGTTSFGNIRFLTNCLIYGVEPYWNLLVGFPNEQEEIYMKYVNDLPNFYHLPPPSGVFPVRFDRYSPYFMKAKEYELELYPLDYYSLIYPFDIEKLMHIAYYFADHNYGAEYIKTASKWLEKLKQLVNDWKELWKDKDNVPALSISNEYGRYMIHDSRTGESRKYHVSETAKVILTSLMTHRNRTSLFNDLKYLEENVIEKELDILLRKGLVFEEKGSMLNLVIFSGSIKDTFSQVDEVEKHKVLELVA